MNPPEWFDREIKLICHDYFTVWNPKKGIFEIRRWDNKHGHPFKTDYFSTKRVSTFVRNCAYGHPTMRDAHDLRRGLYNARKIKELLWETDERNRRMQESAAAEEDYQHRAAAKALWHYKNEPTVYLSGKEF